VKELTIDERLALLIDGKVNDADRQALLAGLSEEDILILGDAAGITREREDAARPQAERPPVAREGRAEDVPAAATDPPPRPYIVAAGAEEGGKPEDAPAEPRLTVVPPTPDRPREEAAGDASVIPLRPRRRFPLAAWGAIAAVLAGVALIPVLRARGGNPEDPARLAAALPGPAGRLPAGWIDDRPWGAKRGGGGDDGLLVETRSARLGALLVDLELAARARDTATVALLANRVSSHLGNVTGAGDLALVYDSIAGVAPTSPNAIAPLLKEGREDMPDAADPAYLDAGAWSEAALLAANAHDEAFFRTRASREMPARISALPVLRDEGRAAAGQVRAALARGGTPDWPALRQSLSDLMGAIAG
jgi:hypothetical protein